MAYNISGTVNVKDFTAMTGLYYIPELTLRKGDGVSWSWLIGGPLKGTKLFMAKDLKHEKELCFRNSPFLELNHIAQTWKMPLITQNNSQSTGSKEMRNSRNWIWPTTCIILEVDSSPEPARRNAAHLTPGLQPCKIIGRKRSDSMPRLLTEVRVNKR